MDAILQITNVKKWQEQLDKLSQERDEDGNKLYPSLYWDDIEKKGIFNFTTIPQQASGNQAITMVRIQNTNLIDELKYAKKLGECINREYVFDSEAKRKTYEKLRGDLTTTFTDEDGEEITINRPYELGVFL